MVRKSHARPGTRGKRVSRHCCDRQLLKLEVAANELRTRYVRAGRIGRRLIDVVTRVLPLVPVWVAAAVNGHRWGALALGAGLAFSFAILGIFLATVGTSLGLDPDTFRTVGAVILAMFGLILLVPRLQDLFARATSHLSNSGNQLLAHVTVDGLTGQFLVGVLIGVVWSPCVGPTLGAATTLASQGRNLAQIALLMLLFGIGAASPLALLGSLSRASMNKIRGGLLSVGKYGKRLFGFLLLVLGVLIATGIDKSLETWILNRTPEWLTGVTTRF